MKWWRRWRRWSKARRLLRDLFDHPERLAGTSLRPAHRGRVEIVEVKHDDEEVSEIHFTILRHPRPYPFSKQFHAVVQRYSYDVANGTVQHEKSLNLSRLKGGDGEPGGGSVGI